MSHLVFAYFANIIIVGNQYFRLFIEFQKNCERGFGDVYKVVMRNETASKLGYYITALRFHSDRQRVTEWPVYKICMTSIAKCKPFKLKQNMRMFI